jgi:endonuclease YncB( thermonuclease family)
MKKIATFALALALSPPLASCQQPLRSANAQTGTSTANTSPIDPAEIWVIDGDTIHIRRGQPNIRLVGFNSPETRNAACNVEADLGAKATQRLRDIVKAGHLDFTYIRCSCPETTQGTSACNYGRDCGTLRSNGRDVGAILIEERLAVSFVCGPTHCPPTPRPWCSPK